MNSWDVYRVRFNFDCTFIFGDVFEENINKHVWVSLVPLMPVVSDVEAGLYLTRVGTGAGAATGGSGTFGF
jgi:hypothetical protein